MDLRGLATRKVGPLPAWGWVAVIVVGWYLYKRMRGGTTATPLSTASTGVQPPTETVSLPGGASYSGPAGADLSGLAAAAGTSNPPQGITLSSPGGTYTGPPSNAPPGFPWGSGAGTAPGTGAPSPGNGGGTPGQTPAPSAPASPIVDVYQSGAAYVFGVPGAGNQTPVAEPGQGPLVSEFALPGGQYYGGTNLPAAQYPGFAAAGPIASAAPNNIGGYTLVNTKGQSYAFGPASKGGFQYGVTPPG